MEERELSGASKLKLFKHGTPWGGNEVPRLAVTKMGEHQEKIRGPDGDIHPTTGHIVLEA